jgi:glycosyltransferase involved in cell wall biosynthesis
MAPAERPWVLVCGGFHRAGGMDRLNAALASRLASRATPVHLVGHDIDPEFERQPSIAITRVPRPAGLYLAGEAALAREAARVRTTIAAAGAAPLLAGNGGNCFDADVNWVHSVHHAWPCADDGAPAWFRAKNRAFKAWSRRREATALRGAARIVANSPRTKDDLVAHLQLETDRIEVIYPGTEPAWIPPTAEARAAARATWCRDSRRPLVAMIGALGHDVNKGIDVLLAAWRQLESRGGWDAELVVAGPGDTSRWRRSAAASPAIRFVGAIANAGELMDAADLLVSPVRYEAYGLAVHEALCRAVPAMVTESAGIVARLPQSWRDLLVPAPPCAAQVAARLEMWAGTQDVWRARAREASAALRAFTDTDMADRIIDIGTGVTR